jgi:predicted Zn-dependent protease
MKPRLFHTLLAIVLCLGPLTSSQALDTRLPDLGASASAVMTPAQERELGQAFMRSVRRNQAVLEDPLVIDYIQQLGSTLVEHSEAGGQHFEFFVIDNPQINAFAGPAGHIGVFTGLILTTDTESELAAVVAHEIAHVTQQHLLRAWETAGNMALPNAAILLAAIAIGAAAGTDAGLATAIGGQAALLQRQINFTRAKEQEADRIGIDILAAANFEPRAMPAFFARMGKANQIYQTKVPEFLLTHPVSSNRTADALGRASTFPYTQTSDDLRYQLLRADLQQRDYDDPQEAILDFNRLLEAGRYRNRSATQYGKVRALIRARQLQEADSVLQALLEKHPDAIELIVTKASVEAELGQAERALQRLQTALLKLPSSYAVNITYAEVAIANGDYTAALQHLQDYTFYRSEDPRVYELMARAAGGLGDQLQSHRHLAEHHYLSGNLEAAILQLEIARKIDGIDFYDSSKVESRLRALEKELADREARE